MSKKTTGLVASCALDSAMVKPIEVESEREKETELAGIG
jgi:hypothetical protein